MYALAAYRIVPSVLGEAQLPVSIITIAAALVAAFVSPQHRRAILVVASGVAAWFAFAWWALALAGFVATIAVLGRTRLPIYAKLALAFLAWLAIPLARLYWLDVDEQVDTILLSIIWAGQLYSAFYVLVEREREPVETRPSVLADVFYLTAIPRIALPFFQPISPRLIAQRERAPFPRRLIWNGLGLGALGTAFAACAWLFHYPIRYLDHHHLHWLAIVVEYLEFYARVTYTIFLAIAAFRLLGFELPSGYRRPFLSRSFAEFFRRFNHYVRDAVLSLFYFPLLGHLRHHARPRIASIASAYLAILVGSFALHDLLIPLSTTIEPLSIVDYFLDPVRVGSMFLLWTLIILPNAGIAPKKPPPISRWRMAAQIALFNVVYFALWYASRVGRGKG